jgi:chemotaxis protein methyltransferase CheR
VAGAAHAEAGAVPPPLPTAEVDALLDHLYVRTGHDFRGYARRSLERRLRHVMLHDGVATVAELRAGLAGPAGAARLCDRLLVNVTSLFRDPPFWLALRTRVLPALRELPLLRVWSAGCATGEEAWSLAILLREEGLGERSRVYATDVGEAVLARARAGILPLEHMRESTHHYARAGGATGLSSHYTVGPDGAALKPALRRQVVFARHNLASDASFNEFHLVLCRNVLIYFNPALQERAHALFLRSLAPDGVLGLGQREIVPAQLSAAYEPLDAAQKLYRRAAAPPAAARAGRLPGEGV